MLVSSSTPNIIAQAAAHLAAGNLVVFPTETVYGLGANAMDDAAVAKIFAAKNRPKDHPLIVHIANSDAARFFCAEIPPFATKLMQQFWPGPLTLILPKIANIATASTGGQDSIGLRCPSNPVAQQLLQACQQLGVVGVAAPSANKFGKLSPTTGEHVALADDIWVIDAGASEFGIESCIIDCTRGQPVLLRPGVLTIAELEAAIDIAILLPQQLSSAAPKAPGSLASHYAPQAQLLLFTSAQLQEKLQQPPANSHEIAVYQRSCQVAENSFLAVAQMPNDAKAAAKQLFAQLHQFDAMQAKQIWIEAPPKDNSWDGVRDRLLRATL